MAREKMPEPSTAMPSPEMAAEAPIAISKQIEVEALRDGFIRNERKVKGDVFTVADMSRVGTWMKCTDPVLEKQHQKMMIERKKQIAGQ